MRTGRSPAPSHLRGSAGRCRRRPSSEGGSGQGLGTCLCRPVGRKRATSTPKLKPHTRHENMSLLPQRMAWGALSWAPPAPTRGRTPMAVSTPHGARSSQGPHLGQNLGTRWGDLDTDFLSFPHRCPHGHTKQGLGAPSCPGLVQETLPLQGGSGQGSKQPLSLDHMVHSVMCDFPEDLWHFICMLRNGCHGPGWSRS